MPFRHFGWALIFAILIVCVAALMLGSCTLDDPNPHPKWTGYRVCVGGKCP